MKNSFRKGISIVEIVISAGIIAVCVTGIVGAIRIYLSVVHQNAREAQATMLLAETSEALQYLRDQSYQTHIADKDIETDYTLIWNGNTYEISTSTIELPYNMTRTVLFEEVRRDSSDQIIESGGTVDENTRKALITIAWPYKEQTKTLSSEMLIHNLYEN